MGYKPVYNKEFSKTKIKSHGNEVRDSYDKKIPKVDSNPLDCPLKKDCNYYPQVLLKSVNILRKI